MAHAVECRGAESAMKTSATILLLVPLLAPISFAASVFDKPELRIASSPAEARQITLPGGARVVDSDVSPAGPTTALLVLQASAAREILLWNPHENETTKAWDVPAGFTARSLVWHPEGNALFVSGLQGQRYVICKIEPAGGKWTARQIYSSVQEIRRLVPGPRPFVVEAGQPPARESYSYRLFFGLKGSGGNYTIHSITEDGKKEYQAIGPAATKTKSLDDEYPPSNITAAWGPPAGVHSAGPHSALGRRPELFSCGGLRARSLGKKRAAFGTRDLRWHGQRHAKRRRHYSLGSRQGRRGHPAEPRRDPPARGRGISTGGGAFVRAGRRRNRGHHAKCQGLRGELYSDRCSVGGRGQCVDVLRVGRRFVPAHAAWRFVSGSEGGGPVVFPLRFRALRVRQRRSVGSHAALHGHDG